MAQRTPEVRAARAVQKVSTLTFTQALEWVRLHEKEITALCLEKRLRRRVAAAELWSKDVDT